MKRSLGIALAAVAATGAVALGAGTAFADDNGPVNIEQTESGDNATHGVDQDNANLSAPEGAPVIGGKNLLGN
ncbi:hypothetical protein [Pseudonocardia spinosispora]|uniref:hypothetical protein n=1 Tax=Pseudonocardia spinosispora TaxID=103441 RepID=UPI00041BBE7E|nr:hypothetical protein [Pseudonocardia spinosispora]